MSASASEVRAPRRWLSRVVRNHATNQRIADHRRRAREEASAREIQIPPPDPRDVEAAQRTLADAVGSLKSVQREAIELRFFRELSTDEVAARTGAPRETVRSRIKAGLAQMREHLARQHGDGRGWLAALGPIWIDRAELSAKFGEDAALVDSVGTGGAPDRAASPGWFTGMRAVWLLVPVALVPVALVAVAITVLVGDDETAPSSVADAGARDDIDTAASALAPQAAPVAASESTAERIPPGSQALPTLAAAGAADLHGERRLRVRVTNAAGKPVAAELWICPAYNAFDLLGASDETGLADCVIEDRFVGAVGIEGLEDKIQIHARAKDLIRSSMHFLTVPSGETTQLSLIVGPEATELEGVLTDEDGAAIVGAEVSIGSPVPRGVILEPDHFVYEIPDAERTNEDGAFRFDKTAAGRRPLWVELAGYVPIRTWIRLEENEFQQVQLRTIRGQTLSGTVRGPGGAPVPGAFVWTVVHSGSLGLNGFAGRQVKADEDGVFELPGLAPGRNRVFAQDPRTGNHVAVETLDITSEGASEWNPELSVVDGVDVIVTDGAGAPLPGVEVRLLQVSPMPWLYQAMTGPDGHANITACPPGPMTLVVARNYLSRALPEVAIEGVLPSTEPITVQLSDEETIASLTGLFTAAGGAPFPRGRLVLDCAKDVDVFFDYRVDDGSFDLVSLPGERSLRFLHPALGVASLGVHSVAEGGEDVGRLRAPKPATLRLQWTCKEGQTLELRQLTTADGTAARHHLDSFTAVCDETMELFPGRFEIVVLGADFSILERREVDLSEGSQRTLSL